MGKSQKNGNWAFRSNLRGLELQGIGWAESEDPLSFVQLKRVPLIWLNLTKANQPLEFDSLSFRFINLKLNVKFSRWKCQVQRRNFEKFLERKSQDLTEEVQNGWDCSRLVETEWSDWVPKRKVFGFWIIIVSFLPILKQFQSKEWKWPLESKWEVE